MWDRDVIGGMEKKSEILVETLMLVRDSLAIVKKMVDTGDTELVIKSIDGIIKSVDGIIVSSVD